jgi:dihydroxy-acid dehydratase
MTMGTASTMASMVEALGIGAAGNAAIPGSRWSPQRAGAAGGPAHGRDGAQQDLRMSQSPDARSLRERHPRDWPRIGGSTNAVMHLIAIAGRARRDRLALDDFDATRQRPALLC